MKVAYYLAEDSHLPVFAYSVFYVFFEQYLYIIDVAIVGVLAAVASVFLVTLVLLRNFWLSFLLICIVAMIQADIIGFMHLAEISLNAISAVNMVNQTISFHQKI